MVILIKNAKYIVQDKDHILKDKDITIREGKIFFEKDKTDIIINGKDLIVCPSLANFHTHLPMSIFRGIAEDLKLKEWLENKIWPLESKLNSELIYIGTFLSLLEMVSSGITLVFDMYFNLEAIYKAIKEFGIRGYLSYGMIDLGDEEKREKEIKETMRYIKYFRNKKDIEFVLGPHSPYTVSKKLWEWVKETSENYNLKIHTHLQETQEELKYFIKNFKKTPTQFLNEIGILFSNFFGVHGVWLTKKDIKLLKNTNIIYNPNSNLKLGNGIAPIFELYKEGANILLGTDSSASNNNLDVWGEIKTGALLQKIKYSVDSLKSKDFYSFAFENIEKALNLKLGKIKEGYEADLILLNAYSPRLQPLSKNTIINHLVYSVKPEDIYFTICKGKIIYEKDKKIGKWCFDEISQIINKYNEKVQNFLSLQ